MKIIDGVVPVEKTYTVELTQSEVDMLKVILGQCRSGGPQHPMYDQFKAICSGSYRVRNSNEIKALDVQRA